MPNWVINKMSFNSSSDFLKVVNKYCTECRYDSKGVERKDVKPISVKSVDDIDELGDIDFDFNRVIQMPAVLNIVSSSLSDCCLQIYNDFCEANITVDLANLTDTAISVYMKKVYGDDRTKWDSVFTPVVNFIDKQELSNYITNSEIALEMPITNAIYTGEGYTNLAVFSENTKDKTLTNITPEERCRLFIFAMELGGLMSKNKELYNSYDWYSWRCKNWGTKWNAGEVYVSTGDKYISFNTAWSTPIEIFEAIAAQNPDIDFEVQWSDENTGYNVGWGSASDGCYTCNYYDDASQDAYETAATLWGIDLKDEGYVWNEEEGTYVYVDEE